MTERLDLHYATLLIFPVVYYFYYFLDHFVDGYSFSICMHGYYFDHKYVHFEKNQRKTEGLILPNRISALRECEDSFENF